MRLPPGAPRELAGMDREMTTATYTVDGMTCGACIAEVMERVRLLPGVSGVAMRFVPDGASPLVIRSRVDLAPEVVHETVEMVGFHATGTHRARHQPGPRDPQRARAGRGAGSAGVVMTRPGAGGTYTAPLEEPRLRHIPDLSDLALQHATRDAVEASVGEESAHIGVATRAGEATLTGRVTTYPGTDWKQP